MNENKGQTVAHDFKIMTFRKLMSLNRAYSRKITIITIVVVKVKSLKVVGMRGLDVT